MKYYTLAFVTFFGFQALCAQSYNSFKDPRDGKTYKTSSIVGQIWMSENLDADRFQNGERIRKVTSSKEWLEACYRKEPVWMYYQNNPENGKRYGKIYNYYAVIDRRNLAPSNYHIPSEAELLALAKYSTSSSLKSQSGWFSTTFKKRVLENVDRIDRNGFPYVDLDFVEREFKSGGSGSNSTGFNAFPAGSLDLFGNSQMLGKMAGFWTSTSGRAEGTQVVFKIIWDYDFPRLLYAGGTEGFYVRCVSGRSQEEIEEENAKNLKRYQDSMIVVRAKQKRYNDSIRIIEEKKAEELFKIQMIKEDSLKEARKLNARPMDLIEDGIVFKVIEPGHGYVFSKLFYIERGNKSFYDLIIESANHVQRLGYDFPDKDQAKTLIEFYKEETFRQMFCGSYENLMIPLFYIDKKGNAMSLRVGKIINNKIKSNNFYFFGVKKF